MKKLLCALGAVCTLLPSVAMAGERDVKYFYYLTPTQTLKLERVLQQKNGLLYAVLKEENIDLFSNYPFEKLYFEIANINCRERSGIIYKMHGSIDGRAVNDKPMRIFEFSRPKDKYEELLTDLCR